jgi:hypothetical protein
MLKRDLAYIHSSPAELESYLLSKDVVRVLPDLTFSLGGILLAHKRLTAANMMDEVLSDWEKIEELHTHWKVAWDTKCHLEFKMRLRQWGDFILGMAPDKHEVSTEYRHQVRNRVILQLFEDSIPDLMTEFGESLERKDKIFVKYSVENDFIWEDEVREGFPADKYWYLYRVMRYEKEKQ